MVEHIGAREARNDFSDLMGRVHYGGQTVIVERSGKPMVAVIPVDVYQRLIAEREARRTEAELTATRRDLERPGRGRNQAGDLVRGDSQQILALGHGGDQPQKLSVVDLVGGERRLDFIDASAAWGLGMYLQSFEHYGRQLDLMGDSNPMREAGVRSRRAS